MALVKPHTILRVGLAEKDGLQVPLWVPKAFAVSNHQSRAKSKPMAQEWPCVSQSHEDMWPLWATPSAVVSYLGY